MFFEISDLTELLAARLASGLNGGGTKNLKELDDSLLQNLLAQRHTLAEALSGAEATCELTQQLQRWLKQQNQFEELEEETLAQMEAFCQTTLLRMAAALLAPGRDDVAGNNLREALAAQQESLCLMVGQRASVVASEYSAELQQAVLGVSAVALRGPVLDVGCGAQSLLISALRSAGLPAEGIDRGPSSHGKVADWLTYKYVPDTWGTILSHQAFSLHFLHQHLKRSDSAFLYASVYMAMLRSLEVGGVFAYAPNLPFIEALLPTATYRCTPIALPAALQATPMLRQMREETKLVLHATQVQRLA